MNREKNIDIQFNKIYEKAERLFKVDQEIKEIINFTDEEYNTMESYRDRFTEIRVIYEKNYNKHDESKSEISSEIAPDNLKLPKLSLKEYDLMPRSWIAFWGHFCWVHEDKNLREEDKFQYLLSSLKPRTKACDIAESYPPSKGNYLKVIDHLKSRFGRKDLQIEVYNQDLLVLVNNKSAIKLTDLFDKLGSDLRDNEIRLETLNMTTSNYAAMLYPVVESCLPAEVLRAWDRHRLNREVPEDLALEKKRVLENLMTFLRHEVEGEEYCVLAENAFGSSMNQKKSHKQVQRDEPTATTLVADKISCIFCDCPHSSQDCQKMSNKSYEDRKSEVMRRTCSLVCLKPGHIAKKCHSSVKSSICEWRLHTLLCPHLRKENPSSLKNKGNNAKKKTSWIRSELTIEKMQRAGFAVIDKVQSSESKEKIKWHFCSPSAPWHGEGKKCIKTYESKRPGYIDSVRFMGTSATSSNKNLPVESKKVSITYRMMRIPEIGDKFSNRHGQKGVCGSVLPPEDLPFAADGFVPDILFNPHGLPSRLTVGMLLEVLASKSGIQERKRVVVKPFQPEKKSAAKRFGKILKDAGLDYYGTQKFYSGTSGEELEADVFCGSIYYFRLWHVVEEKYQVVSIAKNVDPATMQPLNVNKTGAVKFGEMERDAMLSHGAMNLTLDRLLYNSDICKVIDKFGMLNVYPFLFHYSIEYQYSPLLHS
ncbi:DNA-directed RNA polymerase I subunit RPA2 [Trichonephila clavata]|uniref:DNA-directed RNA polymerase n=1 Tax=Trichonephila clavata TaxID=2740835 RepID=A0A8X6FDC1_TRICU|nr:DNA-directed RNA polymerase I subunit RPA2 [Trichonephila clavata]